MRRIMLMLVSCVALATLAVALGVRAPSARPALACTGGSDLQFAAERARVVVLGDAIEVGDNINRAPTVTPTPLRTATPSSPPNAKLPTFPPYATPVDFSLVGYGVTLLVVHSYASDPQVPSRAGTLIGVDRETRANIERALREAEARVGASDCAPDAFAFKFQHGARYLVFAGDDQREFGLWVIWRMRVVGSDVVLSDPPLTSVDATSLSMTAEQYHRSFEGVDATLREGFAMITARRVPLASVLRLIAYIRGDASIAPPDTGSAGLASGRW